jgi:exopolysaccharide biosynthesis polyprenyl glycosylphosphotransferase
MNEENVTTLSQVFRQPADIAIPESTRDDSVVRATTRPRRFRWVVPGLMGCDALSLVCALLAVHVRTEGWGTIPSGPVLTISAGTVIWLAIFLGFGLYGSPRRSMRDESWRIVGATTVGVAAVFIMSSWWTQPLTRTSIAWVLLLTVSLELLSRSVFRSRIHRAGGDRRLALRTIIVGTNEEARRLQKGLASAADGLVPVGCVAASSATSPVDGFPMVGGIEELEEAIRRNAAECVFVASTAVSENDIAMVSAACRRTDTELKISTNVSDILTSRLSIESIDGYASFAVKPTPLGGSQAAFKRCFDLLVSAIGLLLALPLIGIVMIVIRLTSPGPALFRQLRITKDGRAFTMYKFRTMLVETDRVMEGRVIDLTQPFFKLENDPRLTRVGRFLRSTSLDELPQLWNVIRGEMSLVGPRPLPAEQVAANREFLSPRHEVRGGLTGLWQVSGRSELDSDEALRMDRFYIENWSFGLDLFILGRTVGAVLGRKGAR